MCVVDSDSPVFFTPSGPVDVSPGALVFYDVVSPEIVSRCSALSCIAEAGGEARLPLAVSVADFRTWLMAVPWQTSAEYGQKLTFSTICTAAKVADAVDDTRADQWVQLAADHLVEQLSLQSRPRRHRDWAVGRGQDHHPDPDSQRVIDSLAQLPPLVQDRVFAAVASRGAPSRAGRHPQTPYLHRLVSFMPPSLHERIAAAAITPSRTLNTHLSEASIPFIDALACLPASPPQLLSLEIAGGAWSHSAGQRVVEHLAAALRHHSRLASLTLGAPTTSADTLEVLSSGLSTLTSLTALRLGTPSAPVADDRSLPLAADAVRSMPCLRELSISLGAGQFYLRRLLSLLTAATGITDLRIRSASRLQLCDRIFEVQLRDLRHLSLATIWSEDAVAVIYSLYTQTCYDSLTLSHVATSDPAAAVDDTDAHIDWFVTQPMHYVHDRWLESQVPRVIHGELQSFDIVRLHVPEGSRGDWPGRVLALAIREAWGRISDHALLYFTHTLEVHTECAMLQPVAHLLGEVAPHLRTLSLGLSGDPGGTTPAQRAAMFRHILRLPLEHLSLTLHGLGPDFHDLVAVAALTALQLHGFDLPAGGRGVCGLAQMTQLRRLHLENLTTAAEPAAALTPILTRLHGLTALVLAVPLGDHRVFVDVLTEDKDGGELPWRALRTLRMCVPRSLRAAELRAVVAAACSLHTLEGLVLVYEGDGAVYVGPGAGGEEEEPYADAVAAVRKTAARAGVALSFVDDTLGCLEEM